MGVDVVIAAELHPDIARLAGMILGRTVDGALVGAVPDAEHNRTTLWLHERGVGRVPTSTLADRLLALVGWIEVAQQRAAVEGLVQADEEVDGGHRDGDDATRRAVPAVHADAADGAGEREAGAVLRPV